MSSRNHFRLRSEFQYIRESGHKFVMPSLLFVVADALDGKARCGVICSKKYSLLAVNRNRARRLLYESYRLLAPELKTAWVLMIPRFSMAENKCQDVLLEMRKAAGRAGLLVENTPGCTR